MTSVNVTDVAEVTAAVAIAGAGRELRAKMGRRQRDTQVACRNQATAKRGGLPRMSLKRESSFSSRMRVKR